MRKSLLLLFFISTFLSRSQQENVNSIEILGLEKSKKNYIQKLILSQKNTALDSTKVEEDLIRLIREPSISHAYFTWDTLNNKNQLIYHIEENKTLIPAIDIWSTLNQQVAFHLGINEHNFLGRGYLTGVFYRKNIFDGFGLIFGNPNFRGTRMGIYAIVQKRNTFEPVKTPNGTAFYNYRFTSSDFKFDFKPNILKTYSLGIGLLEENYTLEDGKESSQIPNTFTTQKFLFKLNFDFNRLEQFYYFFSGFRNLIQLNNVWGTNFGGEKYFYALENEATFSKRIKTKGNWASRLKIGVSRNFETPFPAFVIDNNLNTRGSGNKVKRGSQIAVINTEYRHTFLERKWLAIQGNGFIDSSWILPAGKEHKEIFTNKNHNLYSGIGIRFIHKFIHTAILRIDYGFSINNGSSKGLVFGIGQYF
jgi:hypothetical protein